MKVKITQSCPTPVHGILQARILEWVKVKVKSLSRVRLFATPWTVAHKAPLSTGFSRQEYWRVGCHFLLQGIFLTQESNWGLYQLSSVK